MTQIVIAQIEKPRSLCDLIHKTFERSGNSEKDEYSQVRSVGERVNFNLRRAKNSRGAKEILFSLELQPSEKEIKKFMDKFAPEDKFYMAFHHKKDNGFYHHFWVKFGNPPTPTKIFSHATLSEEGQTLLKTILPIIGLDLKNAKPEGEQSTRTEIYVPPTEKYSQSNIIKAFLAYNGPVNSIIGCGRKFIPSDVTIKKENNKIYGTNSYGAFSGNFGFLKSTYLDIEVDLDMVGVKVRELDWEVTTQEKVKLKDPGEWWK
jgi:hypothetical protein